MTTGFIILRTTTEPIWKECYKRIRSRYNNPILILDRDDEHKIGNINLINTTVVRVKRDGHRLLPFFYLYKMKCFEQAVILNDTMLVMKDVNFIANTFLWLTRHENQEVDLELEILSLLGNDDLLSFYRTGRWSCSYLSCCSISLESVTKLVEQIPIFSLLDLLKTERHCLAMDRVLSCILQYTKMMDGSSMYHDINHHKGYGTYSIGEYNLGIIPDYPVINIWGFCQSLVPRPRSDTFWFLSEQQVRALVGNTKKLCLFANYNREDVMQDNVVLYINELCNHYERVVVIANEQRVTNTLDLDHRVRLVHAPNKSYDFGLWSRVVRNMEVETLSEVALVNDSCLLIKPLNSLISSIRSSNHEFVGVTDNHDIEYHIQSYFTVFKGQNSISRMKEFFLSKNMQVDYDYKNTVKEFETSLTTFMKEVVTTRVIYPIDDIYLLRTVGSGISGKDLDVAHYNSAWMLWDVLIVLGCPLLKKKRFQSILDEKKYKTIIEKMSTEKFLPSLQ